MLLGPLPHHHATWSNLSPAPTLRQRPLQSLSPSLSAPPLPWPGPHHLSPRSWRQPPPGFCWHSHPYNLLCSHSQIRLFKYKSDHGTRTSNLSQGSGDTASSSTNLSPQLARTWPVGGPTNNPNLTVPNSETSKSRLQPLSSPTMASPPPVFSSTATVLVRATCVTTMTTIS